MWSAEITNDPAHDYRLYIELLEDDIYQGRVELDESGQPVLTIYRTQTHVRIPGNWLVEVLSGVKEALTEG